MASVIDLHCHVLPGVDDGPQTLEESLAIAHAAIATGTKTIVATPHVSWEWPANSAASIARACDAVNAVLMEQRLDLEVRPGAEVALTRAHDLDDAELRALTLGGGPWLLLEPPLSGPAPGLVDQFLAVAQRGVQVVVAHAERAPAFLREPGDLRRLHEAGMVVQVTAGSIAGRFGRDVQRFALELVRDGIASNVASDAHSAGRRPPAMGPELVEHGFEARADWLTRAVPLALLQGTALPEPPPLPEPPAKRPRRGLRRLFG